MSIETENKEKWEMLPNFVVLNPRQAAMFDDRERSGLYLTQWEQTDSDGNVIRHWGHVPKENDCSRIKMALDVNNLFPCNPKGESRLIPSPIIKEDSIEKLMKRNTREILGILEHINDVEFLSKMRMLEEAKGRRERRTILIAEIAKRMKARDVRGVTDVESKPAMIRDASGRMVPDKVAIL